MSADGSVEYTILGSWELTQGDYLMRIDCDGACANETVWLTSIDAMEGDIMNSPMVYRRISVLSGHLPFAISRCSPSIFSNRKQNLMMVVGPDGQVMPLTNLTPDVVQEQINKMNQGATEGVDLMFVQVNT